MNIALRARLLGKLVWSALISTAGVLKVVDIASKTVVSASWNDWCDGELCSYWSVRIGPKDMAGPQLGRTGETLFCWKRSSALNNFSWTKWNYDMVGIIMLTFEKCFLKSKKIRLSQGMYLETACNFPYSVLRIGRRSPWYRWMRCAAGFPRRRWCLVGELARTTEVSYIYWEKESTLVGV